MQQAQLLHLLGTLGRLAGRLVSLVKKGEFKNKQLLIFDAVGKQVRWLQYHLEDGGYSDYYFLAKGVLSAADAGAVK